MLHQTYAYRSKDPNGREEEASMLEGTVTVNLAALPLVLGNERVPSCWRWRLSNWSLKIFSSLCAASILFLVWDLCV